MAGRWRTVRIDSTYFFFAVLAAAAFDPPPLMKAVFGRNAKARRGWELMPQSLRRQYSRKCRFREFSRKIPPPSLSVKVLFR